MLVLHKSVTYLLTYDGQQGIFSVPTELIFYLFIFEKPYPSTTDSVKTWCLWTVKWNNK